MSLIGHVFLLTAERVETLLANPASVMEVIDGAYNDPGAGFVDLDRAWHCLHYLLTGIARGGEGPLSFLMAGGARVGDEDWGEGPPRVFRPLEVAAIADALAPLEQKLLMPRFDLKKLEKLEIYPGRWSELSLGSSSDLGYFFGPLGDLKRVTVRAKAEGLGMIVWIG
jgi:hypothetical protein